jgi:chromosome segregation ATPase
MATVNEKLVDLEKRFDESIDAIRRAHQENSNLLEAVRKLREDLDIARGEVARLKLQVESMKSRTGASAGRM